MTWHDMILIVALAYQRVASIPKKESARTTCVISVRFSRHCTEPLTLALDRFRAMQLDT